MKRAGSYTIIIVVAAVIAVGAVFLPSILNHSHEAPPRSTCINNLRMIDGAKDQYLLDNTNVPASTVMSLSDISPYIKSPDKMWCPLARGASRTFTNCYTINPNNVRPTCKISPTDHAM